MLSMGVHTTRHWQTSGRLVPELNVGSVLSSVSGAALKTDRSGVLSLIVHCLPLLPRFKSSLGKVRKLPVTLC